MFITSFSNAGYEQYGKRFLETFLENCKENIIVYYEGIKPELESEQIEYRNLWRVRDCWEMVMKLKGHPVMCGEADGNYNYRYNAYTFCRKVFAVCDAAKQAKSDTLVWIDADMVVLNKIPKNYISKLRPDKDTRIVYVGRPGWHSECGFVAYYNVRTKEMKAFFQMFRDVYRSGMFVYLQEWHDCYVFDAVRRFTDVKCYNIAEDVPADEEHLIHPMCHVPKLAKYFDHMKGARKNKGYSPEHPANKDKAA